MIQIVNGLEMPLVKQYFDDLLVSIKQKDCSFSRTEKKNQITANTCRASKLLETVISSEAGQIATFWLKYFVKTKLKIILEDNF